jgi:nucleotide-binding universal stress UspA family protein
MKILLPTDGSDFSLASARACGEIAAKEVNVEIRVISVIEALTPDEPFDTDSDYYIAVQQASKAAADENTEVARRIILDVAGNADIRVETKTVGGKPDKMIIREAEEWGADLIVIASHGYGFWARALLGSVTDSVVHHASCSVLIIRSKKEKA